MTEHSISTPTHGRYLAAFRKSPVVLVGFHGYGESADEQFDRLRGCPGSDGWSLVSIQGLHRFYERRTRRVVASWMTSQDRELAIADNAAYVTAVLGHLLNGRAVRDVVFAGFSQGVAMAYRAAATLGGEARRCVVAVGGDVPPELGDDVLGRLTSVLVCRGRDDERYASERFEQDLQRLRHARVPTESAVVPGSHEWSQGVVDAMGSHLARMLA